MCHRQEIPTSGSEISREQLTSARSTDINPSPVSLALVTECCTSVCTYIRGLDPVRYASKRSKCSCQSNARTMPANESALDELAGDDACLYVRIVRSFYRGHAGPIHPLRPQEVCYSFKFDDRCSPGLPVVSFRGCAALSLSVPWPLSFSLLCSSPTSPRSSISLEHCLFTELNKE